MPASEIETHGLLDIISQDRHYQSITTSLPANPMRWPSRIEPRPSQTRPPPATCRVRSRSSRGGPAAGCPRERHRSRAGRAAPSPIHRTWLAGRQMRPLKQESRWLLLSFSCGWISWDSTLVLFLLFCRFPASGGKNGKHTSIRA